MKLGLGTGSTAAWLVKLLADAKANDGLQFSAAATSSVTTELAQSLGIKIHALDDIGQLDLAIDGADEFDPDLNLIKGGGGALLQEKIVETAADQLVVITDASKQVQHLGAFDLPVEVVKFGWQTTQRLIADVLKTADVAGQTITRRGGDNPFVTDEGHFILDLRLKKIGNPAALASALTSIAGVVETGLFLDMTTAIVVGDGNGLARVQHKGSTDWAEQQYDLDAEAALIKRVMG
ncbi:UNVERIFIED_CONTAM: hypothetical protein GTU68_042057 [Idotea baltica]|nr:hypothetical protein [Idotea baltica]